MRARINTGATSPEEVEVQIKRLMRWPTALTRIDAREQDGDFILSWKSWDETESGRIISTRTYKRYYQVVTLVLDLRNGTKDRSHLNRRRNWKIMPEPVQPKYESTLVRKPVQREDRRQAYLKATGRL